MAELGKKIYYEKTNGVVLWTRGEMSGDVAETTLEEDLIAVPALTLIDPAQLGVKQLAFGELSEKFQNQNGSPSAISYRVNPVTEEIEFATTEG